MMEHTKYLKDCINNLGELESSIHRSLKLDLQVLELIRKATLGSFI
jgi:hypothetical protein